MTPKIKNKNSFQSQTKSIENPRYKMPYIFKLKSTFAFLIDSFYIPSELSIYKGGGFNFSNGYMGA